jgi:hypothetical protein
MDTLDWRMVAVFFNVCQFVFMAIVFAILKFNDMKHIDHDLRALKNQFHESERINSERHIENIKSLNSLSTQVANLVGRFDAHEK